MSANERPIAVVGGGASGLMAAARLGSERAVVLLEKEARVGRKLLATGNGRCNLLNLRADPARYHGGGREAALGILSRFPPERILSEFEQIGLLTRAEADGRVYPACYHAGAVLDALRMACDRRGVETRCGFRVQSVMGEGEGEGFLIRSDSGDALRVSRMLIATGGKAAPSLGADGSGYALLTSFGHAITELRPALAPLKLDPKPMRGLKGVRVQCLLRLYDGDICVQAETGEALFTDYGISGIAAMQLSRLAGEIDRPTLGVCLFPEIPDAELSALLARRAALFAGEPMEAFCTGMLHKRIGLCLLREAGVSPNDPIDEHRARSLLPLLSEWKLPVLGVQSFAQAQVTAGGARMDQFDPVTLESKLRPGLFACGEALDVDGDCGGYNLMWAWASALACAEGMLR